MIDVAAYATRLGHRDELTPTLATLRALHHAHLLTVPFENLDIHLGRPIVLDEALLFDKIVRRRRGGFCYELNGLFAALLREIGFEVTLFAAQFPGEDGHAESSEFDHLTLQVRGDDFRQPVLADVAAGRGSFAYPLRMVMEDEQAQPEAGSTFRLRTEEEAFRVWRRPLQSDWLPEYRFTRTPRQLADFVDGSHYHQTSPESGFTQGRLCTRMTRTGRITLSERRLICTDRGERTERELDDEAEVQRTLAMLFGIDLNA